MFERGDRVIIKGNSKIYTFDHYENYGDNMCIVYDSLGVEYMLYDLDNIQLFASFKDINSLKDEIFNLLNSKIDLEIKIKLMENQIKNIDYKIDGRNKELERIIGD